MITTMFAETLILDTRGGRVRDGTRAGCFLGARAMWRAKAGIGAVVWTLMIKPGGRSGVAGYRVSEYRSRCAHVRDSAVASRPAAQSA